MYLDLLLDVVNGVGGLDIKCDGLAREGFHENLHVYRRSHRAIAKEIERDARWPPKTKPGPLTNQEREENCLPLRALSWPPPGRRQTKMNDKLVSRSNHTNIDAECDVDLNNQNGQ